VDEIKAGGRENKIFFVTQLWSEIYEICYSEAYIKVRGMT